MALPLSGKLHAMVASLDAARKYGHLGVAGVPLTRTYSE